MIIIFVLVSLLGTAFIVHMIRLLKLENIKFYDASKFIKSIGLAGVILFLFGLAGISYNLMI